MSAHLRYNWRRMKHNMQVDWKSMLNNFKYEDIYHMVIYPYSTESYGTLAQSIESLISARVDRERMIVVLAGEDRIGQSSRKIAAEIENKYAKEFKYFIVTMHPSGVPGEMIGKGSNATYAAEEARVKILDPNNISYKNVIVSAFDSDTSVYPDYFLCVVWYFLTAEKPHKTSFQPVPLYNNNIWDAPAISRVAAVCGTFWQMVQQERPDKLATFSSHSLSFQALYEIGYWQVNMVSDDSRIYWNLFLANDGDYTVTPISYPISLDANLATTYWQTIKNVYKQNRRWAYGAENIPYILFGFVKNKKISLWRKIKVATIQIDGFWSLATNPLIIFFLGWLPLWLGGSSFNRTVLSHNLPVVTRDLMTFAMAGLILSAIISMSFLPPRPLRYQKTRTVWMVLQWLLVPFTIVFFGAIPGLESQTRLMFKKYMGFWVTPKHRKS